MVTSSLQGEQHIQKFRGLACQRLEFIRTDRALTYLLDPYR